MVITTVPTLRPSKTPTFKPSKWPVTSRPTRLPTSRPTPPSNLIAGLLFNVYTSFFDSNTKFFSQNVPYVAGYATVFSSLSQATNQQVLFFDGGGSIEWFGYFYTQATADGSLWSVTVITDNKAPCYIWFGDLAIKGYTTSNAILRSGGGLIKSSSQALYGSAYYPIRIELGSTKSTISFQLIINPPSSFSPPIGVQYFYSPKPSTLPYDPLEIHLLHEYTFNTKNVRNTIVLDSINGAAAQLHGGLTVSDGGVNFDGTNNGQYVQLPPSVISFSNSITIEVWATLSPSTNKLSSLFSFGPQGHNITLPAGFSGSRVFVAAVYTSNTTSIFLDGIFSYNISGTNFVELSAISTAGYNYIGRNALGDSPSLVASIEAIRIWYGDIGSSVIYTNYLAGFKSSSLFISEELSLADITVYYYATTIQQINVGFFGGQTLSPMFGEETSFLISALDSQCGYSYTGNLESNSSSTTVALAAMNYSITIATGPLSSPNFASDVCPQTTCYCADSKSPLQYLFDSNEISQNITITVANETVFDVTYVYKSGVCLEVVGADQLSTSDGNVSYIDGVTYSCFQSDTTFMTSQSTKPLQFLLFERYPFGTQWFDKNLNSLPISSSSGIVITFNRDVTDSVVFVQDQLSGTKIDSTFVYNNTFVAGIPVGVTYIVNASKLRPSAPFSLMLSVGALRNGNDGSSFVSTSWFIPVLGVIPKEVPNFYPVASNPDLIFLVLRDPPGGASSTTIAAGTTIDFGMSIDGGHTYDSNIDFTAVAGLSYTSDTNTIVAPLGFGVMTTALKVNVGANANYGHHFQVSSTRASSSHYEYSFFFEYDFSTSQDPYIAGHPSDVIIGGGVDLIVNEAIKGFIYVFPFFLAVCKY